MAKTINLEHEGIKYTLEFTRKSVTQLESEGFNPSDIAEKPMSTLPKLFAGAFRANHPFTQTKVIDEIYSCLPNKEALIGALAEMYNEPIETLLAEPDAEKNVEWTQSW